jgi:hypothetical protein
MTAADNQNNRENVRAFLKKRAMITHEAVTPRGPVLMEDMRIPAVCLDMLKRQEE